MDVILPVRISAFLTTRRCRVVKELGSGMDGIVYEVIDNTNHGRFAVKFHRTSVGFRRERDVYLRLNEHGLFEVQGFSIPEMLSWDDSALAIEMTIVDRPFVLDFASARLDEVPAFTPDPYGDEERREWFGEHWPTVLCIVAELRLHGIFMLDLSPSNISFLE